MVGDILNHNQIVDYLIDFFQTILIWCLKVFVDLCKLQNYERKTINYSSWN